MQFLEKPSIDFGAVRDNRRSLPLWLDIDLTTARSISGLSALSINIAGNSFYVDQDTANVGNATVHFQDTNLGATSAPLFVSAGFIANVPFTQILIENTAQAGKRLRIFYGVDIDFQAGINASIAISGSVSVNNFSALEQAIKAGYASETPLVANTAIQIIAPGANINGVIIHDAQILTWTGAANKAALVAKNSAPANVFDGDVLLMKGINTVYEPVAGQISNKIKIPAGKGLYFISTNNEAALCWRSVAYTIL